ncbi:MAG: tRNA pseudouridine(38-40) synthase TruA [Anaerovorax sp.]|nr:tRNA pseudouridine(38-40) synthase TruA [Anaerovorax sp.]
MKNVLLTISYDGTNFSGWQRQPQKRTVQGEIERVLSTLCKQSIQISGTSRTDAGVHALGQRASFQGDFGIPIDRIPIASNHLLAGEGGLLKSIGDIQILEAKQMPDDFHARFDSLGKKYIYRIRNAKRPDLFQRNYTYQIEKALDLGAMQEAAAALVGTHDFRCFMASGGQKMESTVRTIYQLNVKKQVSSQSTQEELIEIEIMGNGFLYNMVRIITGTLVEVGLGKKRVQEAKHILESRNRCLAGHTAPPQGLYLVEVYYEKQPWM